MLQQKQLIDELLFEEASLLENEDQVDDVLIATTSYDEDAHEDDLTTVVVEGEDEVHLVELPKSLSGWVLRMCFSSLKLWRVKWCGDLFLQPVCGHGLYFINT